MLQRAFDSFVYSGKVRPLLLIIRLLNVDYPAICVN